MGIKCSHCSWEGELDERVPATAAWIAVNDVDPDHFLNQSLNCPDCGESSAWILTGDDDVDDLDDGEGDDDVADTRIMLECPQCHVAVAYEDVVESQEFEGAIECMACGGVNPTDDYFS